MRTTTFAGALAGLSITCALGCSNPTVEPAATPPSTAPSAANAAPSGAATSAPAGAATAADAKSLVRAGTAVVLDVRTPDEFSGGHLDRATNIPVDELPSRLGEVDKLTGGDKSKPIVVYCARGARAARAKKALDGAGYTAVVNGGGIDDLR